MIFRPWVIYSTCALFIIGSALIVILTQDGCQVNWMNIEWITGPLAICGSGVLALHDMYMLPSIDAIHSSPYLVIGLITDICTLAIYCALHVGHILELPNLSQCKEWTTLQMILSGAPVLALVTWFLYLAHSRFSVPSTIVPIIAAPIVPRPRAASETEVSPV